MKGGRRKEKERENERPEFPYLSRNDLLAAS